MWELKRVGVTTFIFELKSMKPTIAVLQTSNKFWEMDNNINTLGIPSCLWCLTQQVRICVAFRM